jgi:small subunit ribosomal protein S17
MDKTVVVAIESRFPHPKYEKQIVETRKFKAHDAENKCQIGDRVRIQECRPLSREKRWLVLEVLGHGLAANAATEEAAI